MARICVLGGGGFVGRHVVARLVEAGHTVVAPVRRLAQARHLYLLPTVDVVEADIHHEVTLSRLIEGASAVVNLVGILHSRPGGTASAPYGPDFAKVHARLPATLVRACVHAGVLRLVHLSALGAAADAPSEYLRSKAAGEDAILAERDRVDATVLRPSVIFGPEDRFLNTFAALQRLVPVVFLACPQARFAPVYVRDVAECVARSLFDAASYRRNYDLCGPRTYTLRELVAFAGRASGHRRPIVGLSRASSMLQAAVLERLPGRLLTRDNIRSMQVDSVCHCEFPFGIQPASLETQAASYLCVAARAAAFERMRWRAGR